MSRGAWRLVASGEAFAARGDTERAARAFSEAARAAPRDYRVLLVHGSAISPMRPREAARLARRAADLAPDSSAACALAAMHALLAGDGLVAQDYAIRALSAEPGNCLARTVRSLASLAGGEHQRGIAGLVRDGIFEERRVAGLAALMLLRRWRALGPVWPPVPVGIELPTPDASRSARGRAPAGSRRALHHAYSRGDGAGMLLVLRRIPTSDPDYEIAYASALHLCGRDDLADQWIRAALAPERHPRSRGRARRGSRSQADLSSESASHAPELLVLAAWIALGTGDVKRARRYADRGSRTVNPFDRWDARLALAAAADEEGDERLALAEATLAVYEEPTVLRLLLHKVALHPVLVALRSAVESAESAGRAEAARVLRREMLRILMDPRPPGRRRRLRRLLRDGLIDVDRVDFEALAAYAERGLRCVAGGSDT